ncbi:ATP-binding protein [Helicobacter ganmani]|uniref:ATP-binding protein n=1 Tax=Helicobacter ganmani TaxID=60246 RepID=UPI003A8C476C
MSDNIIEFSIANQAATHLGRKLYNSNPPALAELVANSYDAYATKVNIMINNSFICVIDNGRGLNIDELRNKYAKIGRSKIPESPINDLSERKPMGQKGIGKLAAFSLGDEYSIFTKVSPNDKWITFKLIYSDFMNDDITCSVGWNEVDELPSYLTQYNNYNSGFIVVIERPIRMPTQSTIANLKIHLSRRFYIASSETNFTLYINNEIVDLYTHEYYKNIDFLVYFGYTNEEINTIFPQIENDKKIKYTKKQEVIEYIDSHAKEGFKGWFGSTLKPTQLQTKNYDFNNVIVYMHKKIADENIFKDSGNARMASQYLVGEIQADFLHSDDSPITSSRQGLDISDEYVKEFIENLNFIRKFFIEKWDEFRSKKTIEYLPESIRNNDSYNKWLETLEPNEKKLHNKLLNMMMKRIDPEEDEAMQDTEIKQMIHSIVNTINNVQIVEIEKKLNIQEIDDKYIDFLNILMGKIEKSEVAKTFELIKQRISAIKKLEKMLEEIELKEKFFEEHLYKHPWLISPYWNQKTSNQDSFKTIRQKYYKSINKDGDQRRNFIDILIETAEEQYPIIVELKKNTPTGHAKIKYTDIYNQIQQYRQALIQNLPNNIQENIKEEEIKAYFIISEDAGQGGGNTITISQSEIQHLKSLNIELLKYNQIINNAYLSYDEFIKIIKQEKKIPNFD